MTLVLFHPKRNIIGHETTNKGNSMSFVNGLLFGSGVIVAIVIFRVVLHINACG